MRTDLQISTVKGFEVRVSFMVQVLWITEREIHGSSSFEENVGRQCLILMIFGSQSNVCFYRHDKLQKNYLAIII